MSDIRRITARDIELLIAQHYDYRVNVIVPNVHWGWHLPYEADMIVLRPSGYAIEVEIKITTADLKADLDKRHHHDSPKFRELWFACGPKVDASFCPVHAGIFRVTWNPDPAWKRMMIVTERYAVVNKAAKPCSAEDKLNLLRLGAMRIWKLKEHISKLSERKSNV